MDAAAFHAERLKQRRRKAGRNSEQEPVVSARELRHALLPALQRTGLAIIMLDGFRGLEDDGAALGVADRLVRQNEDAIVEADLGNAKGIGFGTRARQ